MTFYQTYMDFRNRETVENLRNFTKFLLTHFDEIYIIPNMAQQVNQKAIAKHLNISVSTVSKALTDSDEINQETRAKVLNMATKLGYKYQSRTKQKPKSRLVGVLIHSHHDDWQHTVYFAGMSEKCSNLNVSLVMHYFDTDECERVLDPEFQPPVMREGKLDGLILVNRWPDYIVRLLSAKMPCVSIIHAVPKASLDIVGVDDSSGFSILMDLLYDLGHKSVGFFGRCGEITWSRTRFSAYIDSLYRLGLEFNPDNVCDVPVELLDDKSLSWDQQIDFVAERIEKGTRAWMSACERAGYILCRGLKDRGFKIPEDVSITGFDNIEKDRLGCPELTTVSIPSTKVGAEALRRLMTRLRHPHSPQLNVKLQCKFIEGQTTASPPPGSSDQE